jgi:signal transduction histidine kinase
MRLNAPNFFPVRFTCFRLIAVSGGLLIFNLAALGFTEEAPPADVAPTNTIFSGTNGVGSWIWDSNTFDKQTCRFWRSFDVPHSTVAKATLRLTADNGYRLFLDGREVGRGSDWRTLTEYDLTWLLNPGRHVLAVEAFNERLEGGLIMGLRVELVDQRVVEIASDENWRVVPNTDTGWENKKQPSPNWRPAKIVGAVGSKPWDVWPYGTISLPPMRPVTLHFWQAGWFQITLLTTCSVVVLICLQLMARLALQSKAQRFLQLERARIARDIHDDLGARLTQLVLLGEVARSELPADSEARVQIDLVCDKARDLSHAMDEVVWAVNSRRDTLRDFISYVCKYAQLFLSSTPIRCRLDVETEIPATVFDLPVRRNLFLAAKEALNNAAKHSGANELFLRIHRRNHELCVTVEDDGHGFDITSASWERNGMTNMAQRMSEVGGQCLVASAPGSGCRVEFTVPLRRESRLSRWFKRRSDADAALQTSQNISASPARGSAKS